MRPLASMVDLALEGGHAREVRHAGSRQATRRHDAETSGDHVATIRAHGVALCCLVEHRFGHAGLELHVAAQVQAVGDEIGVAENFRLAGEYFAPFPFLLQFLGE